MTLAERYLIHLMVFIGLLLGGALSFAGPSNTTYQAKIIKPDGLPLEAGNVDFRFTILDPTATCVLYSESYSTVNMSGTGGLISFSLGSGVKTYPASSPTFADIFSNISATHSCDVGGPVNYSPAANDIRKIVMQFNDGAGWQTLPAMSINAVPYAMYADDAQKLNGVAAADYLKVSTLPTCAASEALRFNGVSFSCVAASGGGGGGGGVTSGSVITALGYTPADASNVSSLSTQITNNGSAISSVSGALSALQGVVSGMVTTSASSTIFQVQNLTTTAFSQFLLTNDVGTGSMRLGGTADTFGAGRYANRLMFSTTGGVSGISFRTDSGNYLWYNKGISSQGYEAMRLERFGGSGDSHLGIGIGYQAGASPDYYGYVPLYNLSIGAYSLQSERTIGVERNVHATITAGHHLGIYAGGSTSGSTNSVGGDLNLVSGLSTGNVGSNINFKTSTAGVSGTQDNTQTTKMVLTSTGNLGVGTQSPSGTVHFSGSAPFYFDRAAVNPAHLVLRSAGGSPTSLTARMQNEELGQISFGGYDGAAYRINDTGIVGVAAENWTGLSNTGSELVFKTKSIGISGNATARMRLTEAGNLGIGVTSPNAKLQLTAGTSSTSSFKFTAGTLLTAPQSGAVEYDGFNLYYTDGTNTRRTIASVSGAGSLSANELSSSGNLSLTPSGSVIVSSTTASNNSSTGALVVNGGLGVAGNIYSSGTIITSNNIQAASFTATSGMYAPIIYGGTNMFDNLRLESTTNATKGYILMAQSGGNIGMGTSMPLAKLYVDADGLSPNTPAAGTVAVFDREMGDAAINIFSSGSYKASVYFGSTSQASRGAVTYQLNTAGVTDKMYFDVNSGTRMTIDGAGNVGIGTLNPGTTLLDLVGGASSVLRISNNSVDAANKNAYVVGRHYLNTEEDVAIVRMKSSATQNLLEFGGEGSASVRNAATNLNFYTASNNTTLSGSLRMTIDSSGSVGIGTVTPQGQLDVTGGTGLYLNTGNADYSNNNIHWSGHGLVLGNAGSGPLYGNEFAHKTVTIRPNGSPLGQTAGYLYIDAATASSSPVFTTNVVLTAAGNSYLLGGNLGLGTSAPTARLESVGSNSSPGYGSGEQTITLRNAYSVSGARGAGIRFDAGIGTTGGAAQIDLINGANAQEGLLSFGTRNAAGTMAERVRIDSSGNVGVGTSSPSFKMDVNGDLHISGTPYRDGGDIAWTVPSDARLKDKISDYNRGLHEILNINTIIYTYKVGNIKNIDPTKKFTGVLAQNVQENIPEAVKTDRDGYLSLNTTPIFWAMLNSIKEIYVEVTGMQRELASVKAENEELKRQQKEITKYLCSQNPQADICK